MLTIPMKILFLTFLTKGRGTYIRCHNFAKHLVKFGHSVVILTSTPKLRLLPKREFVDGVEVICMPDILPNRLRNGGLGPIDTVLRCLFLFGRKFDVVENFDHRPAVLYPALVSKYLLGTPLISEWTDLHGTGGSLNNRPRAVQHLIRPYEDFTERKSKRIPEKLVVISRWLGEMAIDLGVPAERIIYIPGGADLDKIVPRPKAEIRKTLGLPLDKKIVAYTAGTHVDIDLFVSAVSHIQKASNDVLIITTGETLTNELKAGVHDPKRIVEFGFLPYEKYMALLPLVDVFLFPFPNKTANKGRWPNKIGDYMAAGRPTVSNRTGDIIDLFEKHEIGLLASDYPEDLAAKTLTILDDDQMALRMGRNAKLTAERYYDWRILSKKLEICLLEAAKGNRLTRSSLEV